MLSMAMVTCLFANLAIMSVLLVFYIIDQIFQIYCVNIHLKKSRNLFVMMLIGSLIKTSKNMPKLVLCLDVK